MQQPQEPPYPPSHPFSVRLNISSSDVASFFGLHLSFQSHFPRLSSSPLPFFFFSPALHNSLAIHKGVLCIIVVFILIKSGWISRNKVFRGGLMFLSFVFLPLPPLQLPGRKNKKTDISITTGPPSFMDSHTYTLTQVLHFCLVSQCFWTWLIYSDVWHTQVLTHRNDHHAGLSFAGMVSAKQFRFVRSLFS